MPARDPWIVRAYARLLRLLLPGSFRRRHGNEMRETFAALYAQARCAGGTSAGLRAAARELRDLSRIALHELAAGPGATRWHDLGGDVRTALRQVRRSPLLSSLLLSLFAVGVATGGALFGVVDATLLRPLPLPAGDRLVAALAFHDDRPFTATGRDVLAWSRSDSFSRSGAAMLRTYAHSGPRGARRLEVAHVTPGYLVAHDIEPILGRVPVPGDRRELMIGHGLWRRDFDGSPGVVGREIPLAGVPHEIVGVAPPAFDLPLGSQEAWSLLEPSALREHADSHRFFFAARLRDGADVADARAEVAALARRLASESPATHSGWSATVVPLRWQLLQDLDNRVLPGLGAVAAGAAFLFLITCANAANLLLVRLLRRRDELVLRAALGAGRGRLARQIVVESLVLALLGGAAGMLLAAAVLPLLGRIAPIAAPALGGALLDLRLGLRGLAFCLATAILGGLVAGLPVAARATRPDVTPPHGRRRGGVASRADRRLLSGLVCLEVAMAVLLLVGAGMALRGLANLRTLDLGFEPTGLLMARVDPPLPAYATPEARHRVVGELVERIAELPGVSAVGATTDAPQDAYSWSAGWETDSGAGLVVPDRAVTAGYLEALGVELLAGRLFRTDPPTGTAGDPAASRPVVVTADLAGRLWPGRDPVGMRIRRHDDVVDRTVVGVVAPVREDPHAFRHSGAAVYHRYDQSALERAPTLVLRHDARHDQLARRVREAVAATDAGIPVFDVGPLSRQLAERRARDRFIAIVGSVLAGIGLLVATLGVHGILAWLVGARRQEIGIRMALGAHRRHLFGTAALPALGPVGAGIVAGVAIAWTLGGALSGSLHDVPAIDVAAIAATALTFVVVGCGIGWLAARRASRIDPVDALTRD